MKLVLNVISIEALCNANRCTEHAVCFNDKCVCNRGYTGNGYAKCNGMSLHLINAKCHIKFFYL